MRVLTDALRRPGLWVIVALIVIAGIIPYITASALARENIFLIFMFVTLASSLNILLGYTGYVNFGNVVFFGIGGYVGIYLISTFNWHVLPASLAAAVLTSAFALAIGTPVLRLRGAYFALVTIGVNEAVRSLVTNTPALGASTGLSLNFTVYQAYGGAGLALWFVYGFMFILTLVTVVTSYVLKVSKTGLGLLSIREDEDAAQSLGIPAPRMKNLAYGISAFFPAIAGTLFFFKNANIEPGEAFNLQIAIETIVMVMLGGSGTVLGPVLGGTVYERLRVALITAPGILRELQLFFAGALLLLIILFLPNGVVGFLRERFRRLRGIVE